VSEESNKRGPATVEEPIKKHQLTIYDLKNRLIAFQDRFQPM
jgi:hypothetical protein